MSASDIGQLEIPYTTTLKGGSEGPLVVILGGVHGDELCGIRVVQFLARALDAPHPTKRPSVELKPEIRGNLVLGIGNPEACVYRRRGIHLRNLNRSFESVLIDAAEKEAWPDLLRARELAPLLHGTDYLIDIHGTSSESVPFLCWGEGSAEHERLRREIRVPYVLTDPPDEGGAGTVLGVPKELNELSTTDHYVNTLGRGGPISRERTGEERGVAICYETGQMGDVSSAIDVCRNLLHLLQVVGALDSSPGLTIARELDLAALEETLEDESPRGQEIYRLHSCMPPGGLDFRYEPRFYGGGQRLLNWVRVHEGDVIGRVGTEKFKADCAGVVVFPQHPARARRYEEALYYVAERLDGAPPHRESGSSDEGLNSTQEAG